MANLFSRETLFLLVVFIVGEVMGNLLGFHQSLAEYDTFMHFVGGALVASLLATYLMEKLKGFSYTVNVFFTLGIGGIWEVFEFLGDKFLGFTLQPSAEDTMIDLIVVFSAAVVINVIYWIKYRDKPIS
ncbi:MAG TPA: hypothetical protein VJH23_02025 [archaeon]|nr:hypothetical protein [archaeon]